MEGSSGPCCPCSKFTAKCIRTCNCKRRGVRCSLCGPLSLGRCGNQPPHDTSEGNEVPHLGTGVSGSSSSDLEESMVLVGLPSGTSTSSVEIGRPVVCGTEASTQPLARDSSSVTNSLARDGPIVTLDGSIMAIESCSLLEEDGCSFDIDSKLEEIYGEVLLNGPGSTRSDSWYGRWEKAF